MHHYRMAETALLIGQTPLAMNNSAMAGTLRGCHGETQYRIANAGVSAGPKQILKKYAFFTTSYKIEVDDPAYSSSSSSSSIPSATSTVKLGSWSTPT